MQLSPGTWSTWNAFAVDAWLHSTSEQGAFTSGWWFGGMRSTRYVNSDNNIIWNADPANTLKPWTYKHLLSVSASTCKEGDSEGGPRSNAPPPTSSTINRSNICRRAAGSVVESRRQMRQYCKLHHRRRALYRSGIRCRCLGGFSAEGVRSSHRQCGRLFGGKTTPPLWQSSRHQH
jgi:hypothetical protein